MNWARFMNSFSNEHIKPDHLYVIGEGGTRLVKIGRSVNPHYRVKFLQGGNPRLLRVLHVVPEAGPYELRLHREFAARQLGHEWFDFGDEDPVVAVLRALV
jgi:Meiotically up-regulated gene 113